MTFSMSNPRAKPRWLVLVAIVAICSLGVGAVALANHGGVSGIFESNDGNLAASDTAHVDWNSFTVLTVADDWNFERFQDRTGNPDDIFNGGVKQDDDCAGYKDGSLGGGSSKFDVSDIYLAQKNIDGEEFLFLAWVRVPSSPSASSHIAYEFNKGTLGKCSATSDLLKRVAGDMLIVYDFEGGDADSNVKLARWLTAAAGNTASQCETAKALPCWGNVVNLTDLGFADAKVNNPTTVGTVYDAHRDENLAPVRFGEAGINLSEAGVFAADDCEEFGHAMAVSRSSGNSGIAQMKDKVGPFEFSIGNCGSAVVHKTDDTTNALVGGATFSIAPTGDPTDKTSMTEIADGIFCTDELFAGDYFITEETAPPDYDLDPDGLQTVTVVADGTTCANAATRDADATFENARLKGSILVIKVDENDELLADAGFTITPGGIAMDEYADGVFCTDGLEFDDYMVTESTVPPGYLGADPENITVDSASTCDDRVDDGLPVGDVDATFTNNPAPGTVNILKEDDAGNVLEGIGFTLYVDDNEDGLWQETEITEAEAEASTDNEGKITFTDVPLGFYCAVETTGSSNHESAAPQCFEVELGTTAGTGRTINLEFENPRLHKVIVIVCHLGTDTLAESQVTDESDNTLQTLAEGSENEALLCGLNGFSGKSHGEEDYTVDVGSDAHAPSP